MPSRPKRMLRIVSKCASREEFVRLFRRFSSKDALFIVTRTPKPAGHRLGFNITLADGEPMIRGIGEVVSSHATGDNAFRRPGMQIRFDEVDGPSRRMLDELEGDELAPARGASTPAADQAPGSKPRADTPPPIPKIPPPRIPEATPPPQRRSVPPPGDGSRKARPATGVSPPPADDGGAPEEADGPPTVTGGQAAERAAAAAAEAEAEDHPAATSAATREASPEPSGEVEEAASAEATAGAAEAAAPAAAGPGAAARPAAGRSPKKLPGVHEARAPDPDSGDEEGIQAGVARVQGAPTVLPANPFGDVSNVSLEGFVECTLYEETAAGLPAAPPGEFEPEETPPPVSPTPEETPPPVSPAPEETPPPVSPAPAVANTGVTPEPARPPSEAEFPSEGGSAPGSGAPESGPSNFAPAPVAAAPPSFPVEPAPPGGNFAAQAAPVAPGRGPPSPASLRVPQVSRRAVILAAAGVGALALVAIVLARVAGGESTGERAAEADDRAVDAALRAAEIAPPPAAAGGGAGARAGEGAAPEDGPDRGAAAEDGGGEEAGEEAREAADTDTDAGTDASLARSEAPPAAEDDTCRAAIEANPRATVYGAGRRLGKTPLEVELPCGEVELAFRRRRYADADRTVTLRPGEPATVEVRMRRPRFRLRVASRPPGAALFVSGRQVGRTPATIRVPGYAFSRVQVKKRGYRTWKKRIFPRKRRTFIRVRLRSRE